MIIDGAINDDDSDWPLTEKTVENEIWLLLKQFEELTSGTSSGSANVISTHCQTLVSKNYPSKPGIAEKKKLTLNNAAP